MPDSDIDSDENLRKRARALLETWLTDEESLDLEALRAESPDLWREFEAARNRADWVKSLLGEMNEDRLEPGASLGSNYRRPLHELRELLERPRDHASYSIHRRLARGGMGEILSVFDNRLRRTIAMKVLAERSGEFATQTRRVGRFLDEAQIAAQLQHPSILPVYDLDLDGDGRPYMTMPLVRGRNLADVATALKTGVGASEGWTLIRAVGVLAQVCDAMAYAHSKSVVHRDIKPQNIMVGRFGETFVMDWGLAKVIGDDEDDSIRPSTSGDTQTSPQATLDLVSLRQEVGNVTPDSPLLTKEGDLIGTPSYMAPEQASHGSAVSPSLDIYGVGATLYQLLTGRPPYSDQAGCSIPVVVLESLRRGPPTPVQDLASAPVSEELVAICEKSMARDPSERYARMKDLASDLRAFLEGRVVQAHAQGAIAEFRKWTARNRGIALAMALAMVAIVGGLLAVLQVRARSSRDLHASNKALVSANQELEAARATATKRLDELRHTSYLTDIAVAWNAMGKANTAFVQRTLERCDGDLRGFEWQMLFALANEALWSTPLADLYGGIAVTRDGATVVSPTFDGALQVLDGFTGEQLHSLRGHYLFVDSVLFSPDDTQLASGSGDDTVRLWDVASWDCTQVLSVPKGRIGQLTYSPDGSRLVAGCGLGWLVMWDPHTGEEMAAKQGRDVDFRLLDFMDQERFLVHTGDSRLIMWSVDPFEPIGEFADIGLLERAALSPDRGFLAGRRGPDQPIELWDLSDQEAAPRELVASGGRGALGFDPSGQYVVSHHRASLLVCESRPGGSIRYLNGHEREIMRFTFDETGRIVTNSKNGTVRAWDLATSERIRRYTDHGDVRQTDFSPDSTRFVMASRDGRLNVFAAATGEPILEWEAGQGALWDVAWSKGGEWILSVGGTSHVSIWDANSGALERKVQLGHGPCRALALHPSRPLGLASFGRSHVAVFDWTERGGGARVNVPAGVLSAAFGPDGRVVLLGREDGVVEVRDAESLDLEREFRVAGRNVEIRDLRVSPDGRLLGIARADGAIGLWDWRQAEEIGALHGHTELVNRLAWTYDGERLLSAGWNGNAKLWDVRTRREVLDVYDSDSILRALAVSPNGEYFAVGGEHGLVVWAIGPGRAASHR